MLADPTAVISRPCFRVTCTTSAGGRQGSAHSPYLAGPDGLTALGGGQAAQNLEVLQEQQKPGNCGFPGLELASSGTDREIVNKQYYVLRNRLLGQKNPV